MSEKVLWQKNLPGYLLRVFFSAANFKITHIPDNATLWRAVCRPEQIKNGKLKRGFFRDKRGLSCDLAIFSTIEKSRRGNLLPPWPEGSGLVEFEVATIRSENVQSDVHHDPKKKVKRKNRKNYAHSILLPELSSPAEKWMLDDSNHRFVHKPNFSEPAISNA